MDRAQALAEARRVLRIDGLLIAAGICRYLSLLEAGNHCHDTLGRPELGLRVDLLGVGPGAGAQAASGPGSR
jgi:hypothetical protein